MAKEKMLLTPKLAEKIQDNIYYNMSAEKKIRLTSKFFMLGRELGKANIYYDGKLNHPK